jgi:hypothetical protein
MNEVKRGGEEGAAEWVSWKARTAEAHRPGQNRVAWFALILDP